MADYNHQKVHPIADTESPPLTVSTVVPPSSSTSRKPSFTVSIDEGAISAFPSQIQRRSKCCKRKFLCWTFGLLALLVTTIAVTTGILYLIFQPKLPTYSVDSLQIIELRLNMDMTLYAKFTLNVTAKNPNTKIGIYYVEGGQLSVWYKTENLCEGPIPGFYQGHQNATKLELDLTGRTKSGSTLMAALQERQSMGRIPLDLRVNGPVAIKVGKVKMRKVKVLGKCLLVVDSLKTNKLVTMKASNCRFRLKL